MNAAGITSGFPALAYQNTQRQIAEVVNRINGGKFNATTSITLNASATTTTLTDARIYATSHISFMPTTAHAAAVQNSLYVTDTLKGSATINHASDANTDKTFTVLIIG